MANSPDVTSELEKAEQEEMLNTCGWIEFDDLSDLITENLRIPDTEPDSISEDESESGEYDPELLKYVVNYFNSPQEPANSLDTPSELGDQDMEESVHSDDAAQSPAEPINIEKQRLSSVDPPIRVKKAREGMEEFPPKFEDPGQFIVPCTFGTKPPLKGLCDLGASINLMPLSVYMRLGLQEAEPTTVRLLLANQTFCQPWGLVKDVVVQVGRLNFTVDFLILEVAEDERSSLILGRPFLATAGANFDVRRGRLTLEVMDCKEKFEVVTFKAPGVEECKKIQVETPDEDKKNEHAWSEQTEDVWVIHTDIPRLDFSLIDPSWYNVRSTYIAAWNIDEYGNFHPAEILEYSGGWSEDEHEEPEDEEEVYDISSLFTEDP